jgi:thiol-disulfide isomerase/thioredoxin
MIVVSNCYSYSGVQFPIDEALWGWHEFDLWEHTFRYPSILNRSIIMRRIAIAGLFLLSICCVSAWSQCEPTLQVRAITDRASTSLQGLRIPSEQTFARRAAIADEGLAQYPTDFFLLRLWMNSERDQDARIHWTEGLLKKDPTQVVYVLLHAESLEGRDTPQAIKILESLETAHPNEAQVPLELVTIFESGKFKDKARAQQELVTFLKVCPAPLSVNALTAISQNGTQEQMANVAIAVRAQLEKETSPLFRTIWPNLWNIEFRAHPPAEHDAVRTRIAQDLARFEQSPDRHKLEWMNFLRGGYQSVGDTAAVNRMNEEIIKDFPSSTDAERIVQDAWYKAHPYPSPTEKEKLVAYSRESLSVSKEWIKRWPDDSLVLYGELMALSELPETTGPDIARAVDEMESLFKKNPYWSTLPPAQFRVSEAYLKHKVRLDQVPALVAEARKKIEESERRPADDREVEASRKMQSDSVRGMKLMAARILLDDYEQTKQAEKAREVDATLESINADSPYSKSELLALHAQAAEIEGRKLDALTLYRSAINARPKAPPAGAEDKLTDSAVRLWKELGGSVQEFATLMDKPKISEAADSRWEKPSNALPMFSLPDLGGKTWKLTSFQGKAVLVNVWATWCGPCKMEHPEFQKLYDKLKDRTDVAVITINVDDDLGKVAPYMKENKYTFPVLLGRDVVEEVVPTLAIPRNWFITRAGKLEWEQIGFGPDPKWPDTIVAKLEEVLKTAH